MENKETEIPPKTTEVETKSEVKTEVDKSEISDETKSQENSDDVITIDTTDLFDETGEQEDEDSKNKENDVIEVNDDFLSEIDKTLSEVDKIVGEEKEENTSQKEVSGDNKNEDSIKNGEKLVDTVNNKEEGGDNTTHEDKGTTQLDASRSAFLVRSLIKNRYSFIKKLINTKEMTNVEKFFEIERYMTETWFDLPKFREQNNDIKNLMQQRTHAEVRKNEDRLIAKKQEIFDKYLENRKPRPSEPGKKGRANKNKKTETQNDSPKTNTTLEKSSGTNKDPSTSKGDQSSAKDTQAKPKSDENPPKKDQNSSKSDQNASKGNQKPKDNQNPSRNSQKASNATKSKNDARNIPALKDLKDPLRKLSRRDRKIERRAGRFGGPSKKNIEKLFPIPKDRYRSETHEIPSLLQTNTWTPPQDTSNFTSSLLQNAQKLVQEQLSQAFMKNVVNNVVSNVVNDMVHKMPILASEKQNYPQKSSRLMSSKDQAWVSQRHDYSRDIEPKLDPWSTSKSNRNFDQYGSRSPLDYSRDRNFSTLTSGFGNPSERINPFSGYPTHNPGPSTSSSDFNRKRESGPANYEERMKRMKFEYRNDGLKYWD